MSERAIRIRMSRTAGELEIEGPSQLVAEWWERLWPEIGSDPRPASRTMPPLEDIERNGTEAADTQASGCFGEFFTRFRSDVSSVERMLIAGAFVQNGAAEKSFKTKDANQLLLDQNIKIANPSESVRRLMQSKRVFAVGGGKFRVSAGGFDYLKTLGHSSRSLANDDTAAAQ